jgi:hypothetical protein
MDEFVRNVRIFVMPRTIYQEIDNTLLARLFTSFNERSR